MKLRYYALIVVIVVTSFVLLKLPEYVDLYLNRIIHKNTQNQHLDLNGWFIADLHADTLLWDRNLNKSNHGHVDFERLRKVPVKLQVFSAVSKVPRGMNYFKNDGDSDLIKPLIIFQAWPVSTWSSLKERVLYQAEYLKKSLPKNVFLVQSKKDFSKIESVGSLGVVLAIEGLHSLEGKLENLEDFYQAGYRVYGLSHLFDNEVAGSAHGVKKYGLTDLGKQVVLELNKKKLIIDLAHASDDVINEVLNLSTQPVLVSHTGLQGACPGPRNLTDKQAKSIADRGGIIGLGLWTDAICGKNMEDIVRTLNYGKSLVGSKAIALGSDFDGAVEVVFDVEGLTQLPQALLNAGWSEPEVRAVMGENIRDFLKANLP